MPPAPASSAQALANYNTAAGSMQSPDQIYQQESQGLGVPQAQQQVSGLRQAITNTTNLLNNVAPSVEGRTANSLVTSAQANRQIQNESAPIAATLKDQTSKEAQSESDLQNLLKEASTEASFKEQGQQEKLTVLKNIYDAIFGKESSDATKALEQAKLDEQIRSNQANESIAQQKANSLSPSEQKAQYELGQQQAQLQGYQSMAQQLKSVAGGDGYVSPQSYAKAKAAWGSAGMDPSKFDNYFAEFRNPTNKYYAIDKSNTASLTNAGF